MKNQEELEPKQDTDRVQDPSEHFLVSEDDDDIDASGVKDTSTGEIDDYLGETNRDDKDD